MSVDSPRLVLDARFNDMGQYAQAVGWDLDFRQLEAGPLNARGRQLAGKGCVVLAVSFDRAFHQVGQAPRDRLTFGLPGLQLGGFDWCGSLVGGGALINFNLEAGFDSHTLAGFHGHTISFDSEYLLRLGQTLGLSRSPERLARQGAVWTSPTSRRMAARLARCFPCAEDAIGRLEGEAAFFGEELGIAILELIAGDELEVRTETRAHRAVVLRRALEILADCDNLPIEVTELCARVGTSMSTLKRVFVDAYDLTPKVYIRSRCLSAVRDELATSPRETRISDVANRWGFWHMGQFARDYRAMFGELPSETRTRAA